MKLYISGKITGLTEQECELSFEKGEDYARSIGKDFINPFQAMKTRYWASKYLPLSMDGFFNCEAYLISPTDEDAWVKFMLADLAILMTSCDTIYMLKGWENSKGARIEHFTALEMGIQVIYEEY